MNSNKRTSLGYGLLCLSLGGLWLLHTMEKLPWWISDYVFSWPFLLVVIGLFIVIKNPRSVFGLLVLGTGAVSSIAKFWNLPEGWEGFLPPVALIFVGLILIFRPNPNRAKFDKSDANVLNRATVFGSFKHQVTSVLFKGGFLTSVFGSNIVDFTRSHLGSDTVIIHCTNVFGNSELIVPQGWDLKLNTNNILGSTEDKRYITDPSLEKEGVLEVTGFTLFGSLEIRN
jgi:predicted membrane protein